MDLKKIPILNLLSIFYKQLVKNFVEKEKNTLINKTFRIQIDNKKRMIVLIATLFTTFLLLIGFQVTFQSVDMDLRELIIKNFADTFSSIKETNNESLNKLLNTIIAFLIIAFIIAGVFKIISSRDPFSNILTYENKDIKYPWQKDIAIYYKNLPSRMLHNKCKHCDRIELCEKPLTENDLKESRRVYDTVFAKLEVGTFSENYFQLMELKKGYLYKYIPLIVGIFCIIMYPIALIVEWYLFNRITFINNSFLLFIIIMFLFYLVFSYSMPADEEANVWKKYTESTEKMVNSNDFEKKFSDHHCDKQVSINGNFAKEGRNSGIDKDIFRLLNQAFFNLDQKLIYMQSKTLEEQTNYRIRYLMNLLYILEKEIFDDTGIRVTLFVRKNTKNNYLIPFISFPTKKNINSLRSKGIHPNHFNLNSSNSIVCDVWKNKKAIYKNGDDIPFLYREQKEHLRSIICVPNVLEKEVISAICVDSEKINTFNKDYFNKDTWIIGEVGKRIALELKKYEVYKGEN